MRIIFYRCIIYAILYQLTVSFRSDSFQWIKPHTSGSLGRRFTLMQRATIQAVEGGVEIEDSYKNEPEFKEMKIKLLFDTLGCSGKETRTIVNRNPRLLSEEDIGEFASRLNFLRECFSSISHPIRKFIVLNPTVLTTPSLELQRSLDLYNKTTKLSSKELAKLLLRDPLLLSLPRLSNDTEAFASVICSSFGYDAEQMNEILKYQIKRLQFPDESLSLLYQADLLPSQLIMQKFLFLSSIFNLTSRELGNLIVSEPKFVSSHLNSTLIPRLEILINMSRDYLRRNNSSLPTSDQVRELIHDSLVQAPHLFSKYTLRKLRRLSAAFSSSTQSWSELLANVSGYRDDDDNDDNKSVGQDKKKESVSTMIHVNPDKVSLIGNKIFEYIEKKDKENLFLLHTEEPSFSEQHRTALVAMSYTLPKSLKTPEVYESLFYLLSTYNFTFNDLKKFVNMYDTILPVPEGGTGQGDDDDDDDDDDDNELQEYTDEGSTDDALGLIRPKKLLFSNKKKNRRTAPDNFLTKLRMLESKLDLDSRGLLKTELQMTKEFRENLENGKLNWKMKVRSSKRRDTYESEEETQQQLTKLITETIQEKRSQLKSFLLSSSGQQLFLSNDKKDFRKFFHFFQLTISCNSTELFLLMEKKPYLFTLSPSTLSNYTEILSQFYPFFASSKELKKLFFSQNVHIFQNTQFIEHIYERKAIFSQLLGLQFPTTLSSLASSSSAAVHLLLTKYIAHFYELLSFPPSYFYELFNLLIPEFQVIKMEELQKIVLVASSPSSSSSSSSPGSVSSEPTGFTLLGFSVEFLRRKIQQLKEFFHIPSGQLPTFRGLVTQFSAERERLKYKSLQEKLEMKYFGKVLTPSPSTEEEGMSKSTQNRDLAAEDEEEEEDEQETDKQQASVSDNQQEEEEEKEKKIQEKKKKRQIDWKEKNKLKKLQAIEEENSFFEQFLVSRSLHDTNPNQIWQNTSYDIYLKNLFLSHRSPDIISQAISYRSGDGQGKEASHVHTKNKNKLYEEQIGIDKRDDVMKWMDSILLSSSSTKNTSNLMEKSNSTSLITLNKSDFWKFLWNQIETISFSFFKKIELQEFFLSHHILPCNIKSVIKLLGYLTLWLGLDRKELANLILSEPKIFHLNYEKQVYHGLIHLAKVIMQKLAEDSKEWNKIEEEKKQIIASFLKKFPRLTAANGISSPDEEEAMKVLAGLAQVYRDHPIRKKVREFILAHPSLLTSHSPSRYDGRLSRFLFPSLVVPRESPLRPPGAAEVKKFPATSPIPRDSTSISTTGLQKSWKNRFITSLSSPPRSYSPLETSSSKGSHLMSRSETRQWRQVTDRMGHQRSYDISNDRQREGEPLGILDGFKDVFEQKRRTRPKPMLNTDATGRLNRRRKIEEKVNRKREKEQKKQLRKEKEKYREGRR